MSDEKIQMVNRLGLHGLAGSYLEARKILGELKEKTLQAKEREFEQAKQLEEVERRLSDQSKVYGRTLNIPIVEKGVLLRVDRRSGYEKAFVSVEQLDQCE